MPAAGPQRQDSPCGVDARAPGGDTAAPPMSLEHSETPQRLVDPITGRPVLMAPARRHRPVQTADPDAGGACPFCAGNEAMTPAEVDAERHDGRWLARAFPNLFPAAAAHEVVAEGNLHATQPAGLDLATWTAALALYRRRIAALEARPGIACAFWFKNVGWRAGASIAHNHSQILGLDELSPRLQEMLRQRAGIRRCPLHDDMAHAANEARQVFANHAYVVHSPRVPKMPYETWLSPKHEHDDFLAPVDPAALAQALLAAFTAIERAFAAPPFNVYLLRDPQARFPWHLEFQPRTGNLAGLELGGDMYINSVPGRESAAKLRAALG